MCRPFVLILFAAIGSVAACDFDSRSGAGDPVPDVPGSDTCTPGAAEVCNGLDDNCDRQVDEDIDLGSDESNCGECGRTCTFAQASGECAEGMCANVCDDGWADCNASDADGCEAALSGRLTCGDCETTCSFACGAAGCIVGTWLTAGETWTCASFSDGTARCWGNNDHGQLGTGDRVSTALPREVVGLTDAERVAAGQGHTCALRRDRLGSCWGENQRGQLGDGTASPQTTPVPVSIGAIDAIVVGLAHTCALSGSELFCWGYNDAGQLGLGDTVDRGAPTPLPAAATGPVMALSMGLNHTCAVRTGGEVICFGFNDQGQVGHPNLEEGGSRQVLDPVVVPEIADAVQVSLGHAHSCAVTSSGRVRCWGWNGAGQLGDGGFMNRSQPAFVVDDESGQQLDNIARVVAGPTRTCAIEAGGTASCWGNNTSGALGAGASTPPFRPEAGRVTILGDEPILDVAVGEAHTCFLTADRIRCVGDNAEGQLGDGTTTSSSSGVDVAL